MLDKKNYPIALLEEIAAMLRYFYSIEYRYMDLVTMTFSGPHIVEVVDKDRSGFRFFISTPSQDKQMKGLCRVTKKPISQYSLEEQTSELYFSDVKNNFEYWIGILSQYSKIDLSREDIYAREEENQFYAEFEILADEAEVKALSIESQFKVYTLLEHLQGRLRDNSKDNPEVNEIIEEAENLKHNIQNLPQSIVARKIARLKVKIKKIGIKFFFDVVDVAYKEAIKFALRGGADGIQSVLS